MRVFELDVLPDKELLVSTEEDLPDVEVLPDSNAVLVDLFAELVRYEPELLPERLLVRLL